MENFSISETLKKFSSENRSTLTAYFVLSLAFPINDVVLPYYYGQVIDKARSTDIWENTKGTIGIIAVLWIIKQFLIRKLDSLDAVFLPKIQSYIRKTLVLRIMESHKENYRDPEVGRLLTQISKLPYVIRDLFHQTRHYILPVILVVIATLGYFFYIHPHLGILYLAGIAGIIGLIKWFCVSCFKKSDLKEKIHIQLNEDIVDLLSNIIGVYSADMIDDEMERLEARQKEMDDAYTEAIKCASSFKTLFSIAYTAIFGSINGYSFWLYSNGKISLGSMSSVLIVSLYVIGLLEGASKEIRDFAANIGVLQRSQEAINKLGKVNSKGDDLKVIVGEIIIKDIVVKYPGSIIRIPDLHVYPGETIAIVGKTGCGKSTLAKILVKLVPYQGTILLNGIDIKNIDCQQLRKQIVYVPQQPRLFNRSIFDNITYGSHRTKSEVIKVLRELNIHQITKDDLDRSAGKNGTKLSGGQRQIVHFLRFLFRDGNVIILDEPTSALDSKSRDQILRILKYITQEKTTLIITHDPEVTNFANRIINFSS